MTSDRKLRANRENARASTGPKTMQGRAHARRNALRHGLSSSVYSDPALRMGVEVLAGEIIGAETDPEIHALAHRIAEAEINLRRVRQARHQFLICKLNDPHYDSNANMREKFAFLRRLVPSTGREIPRETLNKVMASTLEGPGKLATILSEKTMLALDRYERRALSRLKFAIRAFDAARGKARTAGDRDLASP